MDTPQFRAAIEKSTPDQLWALYMPGDFASFTPSRVRNDLSWDGVADEDILFGRLVSRFRAPNTIPLPSGLGAWSPVQAWDVAYDEDALPTMANPLRFLSAGQTVAQRLGDITPPLRMNASSFAVLRNDIRTLREVPQGLLGPRALWAFELTSRDGLTGGAIVTLPAEGVIGIAKQQWVDQLGASAQAFENKRTRENDIAAALRAATGRLQTSLHERQVQTKNVLEGLGLDERQISQMFRDSSEATAIWDPQLERAVSEVKGTVVVHPRLWGRIMHELSQALVNKP
jgi:hypothetical protein